MIAGAIIDLDGTILDSMPIWDNAAKVYLNNLNIEAEDGLDKMMFAMSMVEGAVFLKERYCLDGTTEEIVSGINRTIEEFYNRDVRLKTGAEQFLTDMKQTGIKMTAATSSDRQLVEGALKRLNIRNCFDRIFTCTEIGSGKTNPDIYLAAAEFMKTFPKDTWVFEDARHAIRTAKNAGFKTVGVYDASSIAHLDEIREISDIYLEKLEGFPRFLEEIERIDREEKEDENCINDCRK